MVALAGALIGAIISVRLELPFVYTALCCAAGGSYVYHRYLSSRLEVVPDDALEGPLATDTDEPLAMDTDEPLATDADEPAILQGHGRSHAHAWLQAPVRMQALDEPSQAQLPSLQQLPQEPGGRGHEGQSSPGSLHLLPAAIAAAASAAAASAAAASAAASMAAREESRARGLERAQRKHGKHSLDAANLVPKDIGKAAQEGGTKQLERWLKKGGNIESVWNEQLYVGHEATGATRNITLLMLAAEAGKEQVVKLLIARGANVNARNSAGATALMVSAWAGHAGIVRQLLEAGADVHMRTDEGTTVLDDLRHPLRPTKEVECARLLFEYAARQAAARDEAQGSGLVSPIN